MATAMTDQNLSADSWSKYWTQASGEVGCLPGAPKALGNLLDGIWSTLAGSLDAGSRVIDLACGNGVVGASMFAGNNDLKITGVDYADLEGVWKQPISRLPAPLRLPICRLQMTVSIALSVSSGLNMLIQQNLVASCQGCWFPADRFNSLYIAPKV